ncbi:MAG TPA: hypothetical protein VFQ39_03615, partial [Longimicrobium sp.]|nr:hypothetical protein [Longimicrobium sp.]
MRDAPLGRARRGPQAGGERRLSTLVPPPGHPSTDAPSSEAIDDGVHVLRDVTISFERANVIAVAIIPLALAIAAAHMAIWGWPSLREGAAAVFQPLFFLPALLLSIVVHEALHAVGFLVVGRAPREAVHFG